jgi:hypothetical protein
MKVWTNSMSYRKARTENDEISLWLTVHTAILQEKGKKKTMSINHTAITSINYTTVHRATGISQLHVKVSSEFNSILSIPMHDYWDRGFESRWSHGCSSLVFVECCKGSSLCEGLITLAESYQVCVCVCVCYRNLNGAAWAPIGL